MSTQCLQSKLCVDSVLEMNYKGGNKTILSNGANMLADSQHSLLVCRLFKRLWSYSSLKMKLVPMQSVAGQIYRRYGAVLHLGLLEVCEADDKLPLLSICLGHSLEHTGGTVAFVVELSLNGFRQVSRSTPLVGLPLMLS